MWPLHDPTSDPEFRFAAKIKPRVDDLVTRSSMPIFAADMESLRWSGKVFVAQSPPITHIASGTLFQISDKHFLVTAAHVVIDFRVEGRQLRIGLGNPRRPRPIPATDEDVRLDPESDLAVVRLRPADVARIANPRFLDLTDVAFDAGIQDWRCVLFGYLAEGSQASKDRSELLLHNFMHWGKAYEDKVTSDSFDDSIHLLIDYTKSGWTVPDGIHKSNPESLKGLSGASLWRIFAPPHVEEGWTEQSAKVVAVENLVFDEHIIRCTKWSLVPPLIASLEADLERLLQEQASDDLT